MSHLSGVCLSDISMKSVSYKKGLNCCVQFHSFSLRLDLTNFVFKHIYLIQTSGLCKVFKFQEDYHHFYQTNKLLLVIRDEWLNTNYCNYQVIYVEPDFALSVQKVEACCDNLNVLVAILDNCIYFYHLYGQVLVANI